MCRRALVVMLLLGMTGCGLFLRQESEADVISLEPPADAGVQDLPADVVVSSDVAVVSECFDSDGDGFGEGCIAPDCDDSDAEVFIERNVYVDVDGDGYRAAELMLLCTTTATLEEPTVDTPIDCDDNNENVFVETEVLVDADNDDAFVVALECGDGALLPEMFVEDCDDLDDDRSPAAPEICNTIDDNCDEIVDDEASCGCEVVSLEGFGPYLFCNATGTFNDQKLRCEQIGTGYRMVHIESNAENNLLRDEVIRLDEEEDRGRWYIGLSDSANEGDFVWTDGTPHDMNNFRGFGQFEPNNSFGVEDCVEFIAGGWNDLGCGFSLPVICEALTSP